MEDFRKKVKRRTTLLGIFNVFLLFINSIIIIWLALDYHPFGDAGLLFPTTCGTAFAKSLYQFIVYRKALRDELRLKIIYLDEHDEVKKAAYQKAGGTAGIIQISILWLAAIIADFINQKMYWGLYVVLVLSLLVRLAFEVYYKRKLGLKS